MGLGDDPGGRTLAEQARRPEFRLLDPHARPMYTQPVRGCMPIFPALIKQTRRSLRPAAQPVQLHRQTPDLLRDLSQK